MSNTATQAEVQAAEATAQQLRKHCERQITALLARLESLTGRYVEGLRIQSDDVSTIASRDVMYARRVVVELKRAPGSGWDA